jgi:hypothetical protein
MHAITVVDTFLTRAMRMKAPAIWMANTVAVDYLRRMNVMEREPVLAWLATHYPALHHEVVTTYPHYAVQS